MSNINYHNNLLNYLNERLLSYFNVQQFYLTNFQNASISFRNIFQYKWYTELISKTLRTIYYHSGNNISKIVNKNCGWRNFYQPIGFYSERIEMKNNPLIIENGRIANVLLLYLEISNAKMFKKKQTNTVEKFTEVNLFLTRQLSNSVPIVSYKDSQHSIVSKTKSLVHDKQKIKNKNSEKFYSNKIQQINSINSRSINKLSNQSNLSHQDNSSDMTEIKILEDIRKRIDQDFEQLSIDEDIDTLNNHHAQNSFFQTNIKKTISICSIHSGIKISGITIQNSSTDNSDDDSSDEFDQALMKITDQLILLEQKAQMRKKLKQKFKKSSSKEINTPKIIHPFT